MAYVILYRSKISKRIGFVSEDGDLDDVRIFKTWTEAAETARQVPICQACPYEILRTEI